MPPLEAKERNGPAVQKLCNMLESLRSMLTFQNLDEVPSAGRISRPEGRSILGRISESWQMNVSDADIG